MTKTIDLLVTWAEVNENRSWSITSSHKLENIHIRLTEGNVVTGKYFSCESFKNAKIDILQIEVEKLIKQIQIG